MGHINEKSVKILWGGSGNLCTHPECTTNITALTGTKGYTLGEMAHKLTKITNHAKKFF
jgi:hypothetical protein